MHASRHSSSADVESGSATGRNRSNRQATERFARCCVSVWNLCLYFKKVLLSSSKMSSQQNEHCWLFLCVCVCVYLGFQVCKRGRRERGGGDRNKNHKIILLFFKTFFLSFWQVCNKAPKWLTGEVEVVMSELPDHAIKTIQGFIEVHQSYTCIIIVIIGVVIIITDIQEKMLVCGSISLFGWLFSDLIIGSYCVCGCFFLSEFVLWYCVFVQLYTVYCGILYRVHYIMSFDLSTGVSATLI